VAEALAAAAGAIPADAEKAQAARMKPKKTAHESYRKALAEVLARVQATLERSRPARLPVRMYLAGGAALNLHTGSRTTEDVDAVFSARLLLGEDIEVSYRDTDGRARVLYLDRNYNDILGLLHEDAYKDSQPVELPGIDRKLLEVRVLSPLDLAVSKLARFSDQDRDDIELLARERLIDAAALCERAEAALGGYVGDLGPVRNSIEIACRLVDSARAATSARRRPS
jgi:hypothetical protein